MATGFIPNEESPRLGAPVDLYTFTSDVEVFHYADSNEDFTLNDQVFQAWAVEPTAAEQSGGFDAQSFQLTVGAREAIVQRFASGVPSFPFWLEIERVHRDDPALEPFTIWHGSVSGVTIERGAAEIKLDAALVVFKRMALRQTYQQLCTHIHYDSGCKVNRADFLHTSYVSFINKLTVRSAHVAEKPDAWFTAGYAQAFNGARRTIIRHVGNTITLLNPFADGEVTVGDLLDIYAGCAQDFATCIAKYDNEDNYGGSPFSPKDNIFRVGLH